MSNPSIDVMKSITNTGIDLLCGGGNFIKGLPIVLGVLGLGTIAGNVVAVKILNSDCAKKVMGAFADCVTDVKEAFIGIPKKFKEVRVHSFRHPIGVMEKREITFVATTRQKVLAAVINKYSLLLVGSLTGLYNANNLIPLAYDIGAFAIAKLAIISDLVKAGVSFLDPANHDIVTYSGGVVCAFLGSVAIMQMIHKYKHTQPQTV